ncbi:MAG: hypothetical protein KAS32_12105 [Candidatus Peribacteraceae bacterium]|nr:hypothetical protein [Candidatus Peribacteraceae bacterium]
MQVYEIWCEGYQMNSDRSGASHMGTVRASSFKEACHILLNDDSYYNTASNTYWSCQLFDNEGDARKSYG